MVAKFYCRGTFVLKSRNCFFIYGDLIEGHIHNGDTIIIRSPELQTRLRLHSIESADSPSEGKNYVALAISFENEEELQRFNSLQVIDQTIDIEGPPGAV